MRAHYKIEASTGRAAHQSSATITYCYLIAHRLRLHKESLVLESEFTRKGVTLLPCTLESLPSTSVARVLQSKTFNQVRSLLLREAHIRRHQYSPKKTQHISEVPSTPSGLHSYIYCEIMREAHISCARALEAFITSIVAALAFSIARRKCASRIRITI